MAKKYGETLEVVSGQTADAAETVTEQVAAGTAAAFEKTQADVKANMEKALKTTEELVAFGQGNLEAFVKAGQVWAAGVQDLTKSVAATAQAQLDETLATMKTLAGIRTLKDAVDLQTSFARASVEKAVAELCGT